jgi:catechol 2,3-dioxygenase-like lactoylglutathione lyase family enzyme
MGGLMLASCDLVAFVATTDLDRARQFYGETLGLEPVETSPFAAVFRANGTLLRVTPVPEHVRARPTRCWAGLSPTSRRPFRP